MTFVFIREQTEGEYSALEHESIPGEFKRTLIVNLIRSN